MESKQRLNFSLDEYYSAITHLIASKPKKEASDFSILENGFFTDDKELSLKITRGEKSNLHNPLSSSNKQYPLFNDNQLAELINFFDTAIWTVERRLPVQSYCRAISQNFDLIVDLKAEFVIALSILNNLEFSKIQSQFHIDGTSHLIDKTRQLSRLICDINDPKVLQDIVVQCNKRIDDLDTAPYIERMVVTGHDHIINSLQLYSKVKPYANMVQDGNSDFSIGKTLDIRKCDVKRIRKMSNIEGLLNTDNRSARSRALKTDIEKILDTPSYSWVLEQSQTHGISEHQALKKIIKEHKKFTLKSNLDSSDEDKIEKTGEVNG
ncbi:hypothetical protein ACT4XR_20215 (plasmid) [Acinetobacter baumannii]|uniref:hypothetical protein n=1 Tax=Acinetobacter baumannii TaxID=470 RepID=UPI0038921C41